MNNFAIQAFLCKLLLQTANLITNKSLKGKRGISDCLISPKSGMSSQRMFFLNIKYTLMQPISELKICTTSFLLKVNPFP